MVGCAFLLLWGWVEWARVVNSGGMVWGVSACWAGQGLVGVEYSWGLILSSYFFSISLNEIISTISLG